jgi:ATP-dependent helicase/nuclease subunit B
VKPLVGLFVRAATLTEYDDLAPGTGLLGCPVWGQGSLLGNLELRLGLPTPVLAQGVRIQRWSRRLAEVGASSPRFYARSYEVDPVGTAGALLSWRDSLVDGGWNGEHIPNGGGRLDTLSDLELGAELPPGSADRLRIVERELHRTRACLFEGLDLAEPREVWPGRWRRVFDLLEKLGSAIRTVEVQLPVSSADTDLGRLQASLRSGVSVPSPGLRGDGSLVVLRAETSWELAHGVAALLRASGEATAAVIRGGDVWPLDCALAAQGLASQGVLSASAWRPALQVLPLSVELAFEPRDPYRVLELLTLPGGPFAGFVGHELAGALAKAPGIGGRPWTEAKESIARRLAEWSLRDARQSGSDEAGATRGAEAEARDRLARVTEWLERAGQDPITGSPRPALLEISARIRGWLQQRLAQARAQIDDEPGNAALATQAAILGAALSQAQAFHEVLSNESRERLDLVATRQLVEDVSASGHALPLSVERAGRIDPVDGPAGLRCARDLVLWWHCVGGTQWQPSPDPWRVGERRALAAVAVSLPDPATRLAVETSSWRRAILAARKRLVLAIPAWSLSEQLEPHPIWDEIVARFHAPPEDAARITLDVREMLEGRVTALGPAPGPRVMDHAPLSLPAASPSWKLDGKNLAPAVKHSASSLASLVGCPLQWILRYRAGLRPGRLAAIPSGPLLSGRLGHRLVEELHRGSGLMDPQRIAAQAQPLLDRLLREEAATLLRPGMSFELVQLRKQLTHALCALSQLLAASSLSVTEVEAAALTRWGMRDLEGRIDLLLRSADGRDVILDLKWGRRTYSDLLESGLAIQLAVYAAVRRLATGASDLPVAAYFSLSRGELLATEIGSFVGVRTLSGPKLSETWTKLEKTVGLVETSLSRGDVLVTGVSRSLGLLDAARVPEAERSRYLDVQPHAACSYCDYSALCGRAWEGLA